MKMICVRRANTLCTIWKVLALLLMSAVDNSLQKRPPHIIIILADDLGWNDVSFHGSNQIPTPNIDALAYNGIILNSHYVQPLCTPSRAALMTGRYPMHMGMQHSVLLEPEPRGLPLNEKLMPEYLKSIGYSTHIIGKWHLGFYKSEYTPTLRGFDSHYGYWNGLKDYYDHTVQATFVPEMIGYDMRRNMEVDWSAKGKYSTYLFAEEAAKLISQHNKSEPMFLYLAHLAPHTGNMKRPFQAPDEEIAKFSHIADPERRIYAGMVSALDKSVGTVMTALRSRGMLENSIVLFMSDNGAPTYGIHSNRGSNYPLRGQKSSVWDGGSRGVAAIWSPLLKTSNRVSNQLIHITDWLPTFWKAAGMDVSELGNIDGLNIWEALSEGGDSPRSNVVINIDDLDSYVAIRNGDWKYINGSSGTYNLWYGESGMDQMETIYDVRGVVTSATGAALSGFITEQQIYEMKAFNKTNDFSFNLLSEKQILSLRDTAVLQCKEPNENSTRISCDPLVEPCLFNIQDDPCETINLASVKPVVLEGMQNLAQKYLKGVVPATNIPYDPQADPAIHGGVWISWKDDNKPNIVRNVFDTFSPTAIASFSVFLFALFIGLFTLIYYVVKKSHWYKNTMKSKSFTRRRKNSPRSLTFNVDYSKNREAIVVSPVTVAQRVEMFEEREQSLKL